MAEDIESDFKQIKVSRLTLGLIMSVAVTSGVIVWNAAQVAGRIGELEDTVNRVEQDMGELQIETDPAIIARLDAIERSVSAFDGDEVTDRLEDLEEMVSEIDELLHDGEIRWQMDDLFWRTDGLINILRDREWGRDAIQEWFGPGW
jgi:transcriptional regulator with XRE-family HTH domain|tara:strand:+ start:3262 stop:3702 length:441 start_codon:yes stop_codon:yes gene_type:complete